MLNECTTESKMRMLEALIVNGRKRKSSSGEPGWEEGKGGYRILQWKPLKKKKKKKNYGAKREKRVKRRKKINNTD